MGRGGQCLSYPRGFPVESNPAQLWRRAAVGVQEPGQCTVRLRVRTQNQRLPVQRKRSILTHEKPPEPPPIYPTQQHPAGRLFLRRPHHPQYRIALYRALLDLVGRSLAADAARILYDLERRAPTFGSHDLARLPVHLLLRFPDRAALSVRQLDHRRRHAHQRTDDQSGRGGRAAGQYLPVHHHRLRDVRTPAVVRLPRNRTSSLPLAHYAQESRAVGHYAHGHRRADPDSRLPRERGQAGAQDGYFPAQCLLQREGQRIGVPQDARFPANVGGFSLRGSPCGRRPGAGNLCLRHRRSVAGSELAALRLRPRDQSPPEPRSGRGRLSQPHHPEQRHPQKRADDPLVRWNRRARRALPPPRTAGPVQRGGFPHLVPLEPGARRGP